MASRRSTGKLDLYQLHKAEYEAPRTPRLVRVGPAKYLGIAGTSRPGDATFQSKLGALYGMAYTLKFQEKAKGRDFKVAMLEGLYTTVGAAPAVFAPGMPLHWKLIVRVPERLRESDLELARAALASKGKEGPFDEVEMLTLREAQCVQMLHVGSYASERTTIDSMLAFARSHGLETRGEHHEIYLSDPRRVPEERLRTILRHPVAPSPAATASPELRRVPVPA